MGTVKGDVHDIGKNLCNIMLEGAGFTVIDLGVNVPPEKFVEEINENEPDIVGFSAFLTTTMPMFKANMNALQKAGIRDKVAVMVGGAPVTQEYADAVGRRRLLGRRLVRRQEGQGAARAAPQRRPRVRRRSSHGHGSAGAVQDRRDRPGAAVLHHRRADQPDRAQEVRRAAAQQATSPRSSSDANAQMAAGADVLDVNAGIPLVDEAELLASMLKLVQETTDAPICIDSSVIEALEAGLAVYEGKPLVNSVTGEDERLEEILPLVAKHGAAVIGAGQRRDRDPRDAAAAAGDRDEDRQGRRRLRHPARGRRDRSARDDGRRRHRGRDDHARDDPADPRRARREHVARRVERVLRAAATGTRSTPPSCRWRWRRASRARS